MTDKLIFSGFGGQGVLTLAQIVAILGMKKDKQVTWMPSYGAEMRGGTSNATVIVSDEFIASPIVVDKSFDYMIVMNNPSVDKFLPRLKDGGIAIINSSMVTREITGDVRVIPIDATNISSKAGNLKSQNMVMLGAFIGASKAFTLDEVLEVFKEKFTGKKSALIDVNMECVKMGIAAAEEALK